MAKDYYETLGVARNATEDDLKKAYRNLARKFHPDLHPEKKAEMEAKFKEINEAYGVLSDPKKRSDYDLTGSASYEPGMGKGYPPPGGSVHFEDFGFGNIGGFEDVFSEIFGRGGRRGPRKGSDLEYSITLDFMQAVKGAEVRISVPKRGGVETITVKIPPGVKGGGRVRVPGKGEPGEGGSGDLYIITEVQPHRYLRRVDNDIYVDVPITIKEAVLGADIKVPAIDGMTTIKVPPGIRSGQRLRIKGKGVYVAGGRGDEYVIIQIAAQKASDNRSKELIEEFSRINPYDPRKGLW